jgi:threonine-phosphate decarboxylase
MTIYAHGGNVEEWKERFNLSKENILDFSANINPLGPPKKVMSLIRNNLESLSTYPSIYSDKLRSIFAEYRKIKEENILVTNGSIEAIYLSARLIGEGRSLIVIPTFSEYERAVISYSGKAIYIKNKEKDGFDMDFNLIFKKLMYIDSLFITNPNNPTGRLFSKDELIFLAKRCKRYNVFLIIDEAFIDFLPKPEKSSLITYCANSGNILVIGSLTKFFALPGLRIGYMASAKKIIRKVSGFCFPWAVNTFAQLVAGEALSDIAYIKKSRKFIKKEKDFLYEQLKDFSQLRPYYPAANFILCRIERKDIDAPSLFKRLGEKGIFIRDCSNFRGLGRRYFRIGVRKRKDNLVLLHNLSRVFGSNHN